MKTIMQQDDLFDCIFLPPINVFWHICGLNHWRSIVDDQLLSLYQTYIYPFIDKIYISFIGTNRNDIKFLLNLPKIQLVSYTNQFDEYERPCLNSLLDWSKKNDSNIFYMHTKGVKYPDNHNVWLWRQLLERILLSNYSTCLAKLNYYDVVGINLIDRGTKDRLLKENHNKHFSGNFWWSKTSYIKKLTKIRPDIQKLSHKQYWLCERWICSLYPDAKLYNLASTRTPYYYHSKPPDIESIEVKI